MSLPPALTKMVGPLPAGAWVAAIGGALGLAQLTKRRRAAATVEAPTVTANGAVPWPSTTAVDSGYLGNGGAVGLGSILNNPPEQRPITSNEEWSRAAVLTLTGRGYGAYASQQALAKYLQGLDALTAEQANIVESALRLIGPPPQPPTVAPPPRPPAPTWSSPRPAIAGTIDKAGAVMSGAYFGLAGSGVAIDPADPALGRWGSWQNGAYIAAPPGYRDFAISAINNNLRQHPEWGIALLVA